MNCKIIEDKDKKDEYADPASLIFAGETLSVRIPKKECEFSQLGANEMDCHCDRQCKWAAIGAYFSVCTDATKSFEEAPQWTA